METNCQIGNEIINMEIITKMESDKMEKVHCNVKLSQLLIYIIINNVNVCNCLYSFINKHGISWTCFITFI